MTEQDMADFDHFDRNDAWILGVQFAEDARAKGHPIAIGIWLGDQRVFAAGLTGSSAMNDAWVERKARIARHFERPSREVFETFASKLADFYERFGLARADYAASEGAVPIRVNGTLVGVISASGLDGGGDHELVVAALKVYRQTASD